VTSSDSSLPAVAPTAGLLAVVAAASESAEGIQAAHSAPTVVASIVATVVGSAVTVAVATRLGAVATIPTDPADLGTYVGRGAAVPNVTTVTTAWYIVAVVVVVTIADHTVRTTALTTSVLNRAVAGVVRTSIAGGSTATCVATTSARRRSDSTISVSTISSAVAGTTHTSTGTSTGTTVTIGDRRAMLVHLPLGLVERQPVERHAYTWHSCTPSSRLEFRLDNPGICSHTRDPAGP
jgi:hypothetical protein